MIHRCRSLRLSLALVLAVGLAGGTATYAGGVLGAYHDADALVRLRRPTEARERRFTLEDGKIVVARKKIDLHFKDRRRDLQYKIKMSVRGRVSNADEQVVTVDSGRLYVKDLETGEIIARSDRFRPTRFQLAELDGTRVVRNPRPIKITRIRSERPFRWKTMCVQTRAFRNANGGGNGHGGGNGRGRGGGNGNGGGNGR